jgi:hypothetical protein
VKPGPSFLTASASWHASPAAIVPRAIRRLDEIGLKAKAK